MWLRLNIVTDKLGRRIELINLANFIRVAPSHNHSGCILEHESGMILNVAETFKQLSYLIELNINQTNESSSYPPPPAPRVDPKPWGTTVELAKPDGWS